MRIGIDCRLWNETGIGRYIRNLVWSLSTLDKSNQYILFFKLNEFKNIQLPGKNFQKKLADIHWHSLEEQIKFPSILINENLDLVHFPYFSMPILYTKPYIITIHDLIINHFPTGKASTKLPLIYWFKFIFYKGLLFFAIKNAKRVITVSGSTKEEIIRHFNIKRQNIDITFEGVDKNIHTMTHSTSIIAFPYFLYVGNAYPHKNLENLIIAFKMLKEQTFQKVKFILVGKQDYFYLRLKKIVASLGLLDSVLFYEKVSDAGLASLYGSALALVSPSFMEGFGLPVVEAMSMHCLVAVSYIDVYREICAENAVYFDPKNIDNMYKVLSAIADGSMRDIENKKKNGYLRAKEFSWEEMGRKTLRIYESCSRI